MLWFFKSYKLNKHIKEEAYRAEIGKLKTTYH